MDPYSKLFEIFGALRAATVDAASICDTSASPGIIDLKKLDERGRCIHKLSELQTCVAVFTEELTKRIADCKAVYETEVTAIGNFLKSKGAAPTTTPTTTPTTQSVWAVKRILGKEVANPLPAWQSKPPGLSPPTTHVPSTHTLNANVAPNATAHGAAAFSVVNCGAVNYSGAGYSGAGYSGAGYSGAGYSGANYSGANYSGAGYSGAGYSAAGYSGAGYSGANYSAPPTYMGDRNAAKDAQTTRSRYSRIPLASEMYCISAIKVPEFENVIQDGELYYVENANHFAFRLAGQLYHGNVGEIYTNEQDPHCVKPCRFGGECTNPHCTYYHDPLHAHGKRDVRNYIASSWLYASPHSLIKGRKNARRYGSRPYLASDAQGLTEEESGRFRDQAMHDFLCGAALRENY